MPEVSVIIPAYNHAAYLSKALTSVLTQSYKDFEVIVVDDGSTDDTPSVVPRNNSKVRYIRQENHGLSASRNTGIREARGRIIGLLDADDLYEPTFLERTVRLLKEKRAVDALYCGYQFVDDSDQPLPYSSSRTVPPDSLFRTLLFGNFLVPACVLAYKRCYEVSGPFDTTLRAAEDWDMWLRFSQTFKVVGTREKLVRYRILGGSMSSDPDKMLKNRKAVLHKYLPAEGSGIDSDAVYAAAYLRTAVEYLQCRDEENAYRYFEYMCRLAPGLLTFEETFYELLCGIQPRGYSGYVATLKIADSERVVGAMLRRLFTDGEAVPGHYHDFGYSAFYYALGKLLYAKDQFRHARTAFVKAVRFNSRLALSRTFLLTLLKCQLLARATPAAHDIRGRRKTARKRSLSA
ncbi:MAG: glycosyltransferase [Acidobacteria bacterium]|nr:MAG: glycosyltransferase [Acidobacteriota bacterium]